MVNREEPIKRSQVEARQGTSAPRLRYVLIGGLVLAVLAFIIIMNVRF